MYHALSEVLGPLPLDTVRDTQNTTQQTVSSELLWMLYIQLVFCGHEYTEKSLQFAQYVEPCNTAITDKIGWVKVHILQYDHRNSVFVYRLGG